MLVAMSMTSAEEKKHSNPAKLDSRVVVLGLNQWIDRPWPDAIIRSLNRTKLKQSHRLMDSTSAKPKNDTSVKNFESRCEKTSDGSAQLSSTGEKRQEDQCAKCDTGYPDATMASSEGLPSRSCKFPPLQLGLPFWPDEKLLRGQATPRAYFSLPQDYKDDFKDMPKNSIKPLSEDEKAWQKNVGGTLFTGEGNVVSHGSYMTGYDWSRPTTSAAPLARLPWKKMRVSRCQSLPNFDGLLEVEGGLLTARSETISKTSGMTSKSPVSTLLTQNRRRPMSASYTQTPKAGQFCSPRSVLLSPMSSRASWSPRSGNFPLESTPRFRELFGGSISARESIASRNQAERISHRVQSARREDAAAVRSLI